MAMIFDNVAKVKAQIDSVMKRLGRSSEAVTLIGVTKTAEIDQIKEALKAGLKDIGENRVQEGLRKFPDLHPEFPSINKHMIGHLQTNKVKQALKFFDVIQSVDSLKLAQEIDKQSQLLGQVTNILIQVNTSGEEQKYGVEASGALKLLEEVAKLQNVTLLGLMTMAPFTEDKDIVRQTFRDLKKIYDQAKKAFATAPNISMQYLSMGMSGDFEVALEEGSNMVRIGSAIFKKKALNND